MRDTTGGNGKAASVQRMFAAIAPRYDLLNHLLSLNLDRVWRRRAVDRLLANTPLEGLYLDCCAGTLDLTRELASRRGFRGHAVACDFSLPMLQRGLVKIAQLPVACVCADALQLPLLDASVDGAIVGFGVRNLSSTSAGLKELARVLKPGARVVILEFTTPTRQPLRGAYLLYFRRVLPMIGRMISRHRTAYEYLPASVLEFPAPADLARLVESAGFAQVDWEVFSGGIVAVHTGVRH